MTDKKNNEGRQIHGVGVIPTAIHVLETVGDASMDTIKALGRGFDVIGSGVISAACGFKEGIRQRQQELGSAPLHRRFPSPVSEKAPQAASVKAPSGTNVRSKESNLDP